MVNGSKEIYEKLIRSSPLFKFDKVKEPTAYKREAIKFVEYLYCYLISINENKYIEFGLEITETARRCINNYNENYGDFLSYFNVAWAKEYRRAFGKRQAEQFRCGIHVTEDDRRLVSKYLRFIERYSNRYDETTISPLIAKALGISDEKVKEIIQLNNISFISGDAYANEEESAQIFDVIGLDYEDDSRNDAVDVLSAIEREYLQLQERQKKLISKLVTLKISESLHESESLYEKAIKHSFFDTETYNISKKTLITAKDIALQCGVSEQSSSRSLKIFIERIKLKQNT